MIVGLIPRSISRDQAEAVRSSVVDGVVDVDIYLGSYHISQSYAARSQSRRVAGTPATPRGLRGATRAEKPKPSYSSTIDGASAVNLLNVSLTVHVRAKLRIL